jgi:hypothetical protein
MEMKNSIRILVPGLGIAAGLVALSWFFRFDPAIHPFYLKCPFHVLTGWLCPLCGMQRGIHDLLHLEWGNACADNLLLVLLLAAWLFRMGWQFLSAGRKRFPWKAYGPLPFFPVFWLFGGMLFWLLRNLPFFDFLRPG